MINNHLFWHKYRPDTIKKENGKIPMIILPRIEKIVEKWYSGDHLNMIFYGRGGTGKSTLAEILTKDTDFLKIEGSSQSDRGIGVYEKLENHCNLINPLKRDKIKVIWIDEFDNTTPDMRKALRSFIEKYITRVRFILTVNNLNKLMLTTEDEALMSRFNKINFESISDQEKTFLKSKQFSFLKNILKEEKSDISDDILKKLINNTFPIFRSSVQELQEMVILGSVEKYENVKNEEYDNLFSFLFNNNNDPSENVFYVLDNYRDKTQDLLSELSKPLFQYLSKKEKNRSVLAKILKLMKEYNAEYGQTLDPELHLASYITDLKEILKK